MRNFRICLCYDGGRYRGWQKQGNTDGTIQEKIEALLSRLLAQPVEVAASGRTDAGVHALRYCANFRSDTRIPLERLPLAVNARLPGDIAVLEAVEAPEDFNAIGSCIKKEYVYKILNSNIRDPFLQKRVCFYPQHLDMALMRRAGRAFEGTHDFRAVRSEGTQTKTTVRTVHWCRAEKEGDLITISICANGFLYNMCRAMVGTMIYASYGKLLPEDIPHLLEMGDRRLTGPTMPPQGLYLNRVWYDGAVGEMFSRY